MLEKIDLSKSLNKKDFKGNIENLRVRLANLQRQAKAMGIPVVVVFEGWGASGKGTVINELINPLEPRYFKVHSIRKPKQDEVFHPFLWRFWIKTPERGKLVIFDRSWYSKVLVERMDNRTGEKKLQAAFDEIISFERQLTDDGAVIIKLFLHISDKEQKTRLKQLESAAETKWRVTQEDWKHNKQYKDYIKVYNEMFEKTDLEFAPWTIIEANDKNFAVIKTMSTVIAMLEQKIAGLKAQSNSGVETRLLPKELSPSILAGVDLSKAITKDVYNARAAECQAALKKLESKWYLHRRPIIIVFEGWDAAGKGGAIRRLTRFLDPRNYEVIPISAPTETEKAHHYLWRFWNAIPKAGHCAIYDRSWYGRVLVERVEKFATDSEWQRAYREINEMEAHLTNFGAVIIKFWMHIDRDEQEKRFLRREQNPEKQWKLTDEDWRNREKWDAYMRATDDMLLKTSTTYAPWTIIEANSKPYARLAVIETAINEIGKRIL